MLAAALHLASLSLLSVSVEIVSYKSSWFPVDRHVAKHPVLEAVSLTHPSFLFSGIVRSPRRLLSVPRT